MTYYAVIDTNVLVSALLSSHEDAATVQVVEKVFSGHVIPLFSDEIMKEYSEVLRRAKFHFSEEMVRILLQTIEKYGECVDPTPTGELLPDRKDLPFYEVVVEKREDDAYLVTGNRKHFPMKPFIVTAKEFLDILNADNLRQQKRL
jgi:putative PIN family toxin of toxin-antitoxin system